MAANIHRVKVPSRWLWRQAYIACLCALAGNLAVLYWARSRTPFFEPLQVPNVLVWTLGSVAGAVLTYQYFLKRSVKPARNFLITAAIVLLVSFLPNIAFFKTAAGPSLGTPTAIGIYSLMAMHVIVAMIVVPLLLKPPTRAWATAHPHEFERLDSDSGDSTTTSPVIVGLTALFAAAITVSAYETYHVLLFTFLFASPFVIGFAMWLIFPARVRFSDIRFPYFLTLLLFVSHLVEEHLTGYMPLLMKLTGASPPHPGSLYGAMLGLGPLTWLIGPFFLRSDLSIGIYFAWSFFAAAGVTELAHFLYPFLTGGPYAYFPGMATAPLVAAAAWWGMYRLVRCRNTAVPAAVLGAH